MVAVRTGKAGHPGGLSSADVHGLGLIHTSSRREAKSLFSHPLDILTLASAFQWLLTGLGLCSGQGWDRFIRKTSIPHHPWLPGFQQQPEEVGLGL